MHMEVHIDQGSGMHQGFHRARGLSSSSSQESLQRILDTNSAGVNDELRMPQKFRDQGWTWDFQGPPNQNAPCLCF